MSSVPTSPGIPPREPPRPRQRDRRAGLNGLLASLTPALRRSGGALLRPMFEEAARRVVGAEYLRLVDHAGGAPAAHADARAITVPVPADPAAGAVVLEAVSGRGRAFDAWQLQLLHGAGYLAAWLVELERVRQAGSSTGAGTRVTDGAAPLIGSSVAMRALRHKIERVAATDFTVLIDGGSGAEAHPRLAVRVCNSRQWQGGEVEGAEGARCSEVRRIAELNSCETPST